MSRRVSACPVLAHTASDLLVSAVEVQVAVGQLWTLHHANMEGTKHVQSEVLVHQCAYSRSHTTGTLVFTAPAHHADTRHTRVGLFGCSTLTASWYCLAGGSTAVSACPGLHSHRAGCPGRCPGWTARANPVQCDDTGDSHHSNGGYSSSSRGHRCSAGASHVCSLQPGR